MVALASSCYYACVSVYPEVQIGQLQYPKEAVHFLFSIMFFLVPKRKYTTLNVVTPREIRAGVCVLGGSEKDNILSENKKTKWRTRENKKKGFDRRSWGETIFETDF